MSRLSSSLFGSLNNEYNKYIEKLREKNVLTTTDFVSFDSEELVNLTGIPFKEMVALRNLILAQHAALPVRGDDLYRSLVSSLSILSTGVKGLDDTLGGGLYMGEVTEIVGDIAAGKTQICFKCCVTTAGDSHGHVIYIDTGGSFSAHRVKQLLELKGVTQIDAALQRIQCYHAFTLFDLFTTIEDIRDRQRLSDDDFYRDVKLVIVDNIASVVYPILGGDNFTEYQALIGQLGHMLKSLAVEYPCAVLVTNNFVKGDNKTRVASLGRAWSHVPHVRIGIEEGTELSNLTRTVTVMKTCRGPVGLRGAFQITEEGEVK